MSNPLEDNNDTIRTLTFCEHVRRRPRMYIGWLGDGSLPKDGVYVLLYKIIAKSVEEHLNGFGNLIEITITDNLVTVRDFGQGIPLNLLISTVSEDKSLQKNFYQKERKYVECPCGIGLAVVNALSSEFTARSVQQGSVHTVTFVHGLQTDDKWENETDEKDGTMISFRVDTEIFGEYSYNMEYVEHLIKTFCYLNKGLTIKLNGTAYTAENGLLDLINENIRERLHYPPIHLSDDNVEVVIAHSKRRKKERCYSFVNELYTPLGGKHQEAFLKSIVTVLNKFYNNDFHPSSIIYTSLVAAIAIKASEPWFDGANKIKLLSKEMWSDGPSIHKYITKFLNRHLTDYLNKNTETADKLGSVIGDKEYNLSAKNNISRLSFDYFPKK